MEHQEIRYEVSEGIATITLQPGRYLITAEFPGFEPGVLKDVRVRAGARLRRRAAARGRP